MLGALANLLVLGLVGLSGAAMAGLVARAVAGSRERQKEWHEVVTRCGLVPMKTDRWTTLLSLQAQGGPVEILAHEEAGGIQLEATVKGAPPDLADVVIRRETLKLPGTREVEIGHDVFDSAFLVQGTPRYLAALLDARTRRMLLEAGAETALSLSGGRLRAQVKWDQLARVLPLVVDLGRRLAEITDVPRSLEENVRRDPHPGVRLHSLLLLLQDYPGYPSTEEALRIAREDDSAQVRLEAARELRDVATLAGMMARDSFELAVAAARALGETRNPAAEPPLLEALARDNPALQAAAAAALGRAGSAGAVPPLLDLAESPSSPRELRRAARQAVAEIQSRLAGATPGQLSLAATDAGQLSLAPAQAGQLSIAPHAVGELTVPPPPGVRTRSGG
ncbi:MAG TPA: HEAT repeat domain-containing protein [Thermoanaerobaculia bacterium]|nr:HEAT repeat domain-containing protein [Thermoanaerobaculia bacterium]